MDDLIALIIAVLLSAGAYVYLLLKAEQNRRRYWMKPWLARRGRPDVHTMDQLYDELLDVSTTWSSLM